MAKEHENEGVDENSAEHEDEDPEVVQPEPLALVVGADPALLCVSLGTWGALEESLPRHWLARRNPGGASEVLGPPSNTQSPTVLR